MNLKFQAAVIILSLFCSCAALPARRSPDFSSYDVFIPVDFRGQKYDTACGLAAIEMLAGYYGKTLDARYAGLLVKEARLTKGIQAASLKACLEASGFDVAVFPGTLDRGTAGIYRHLDLNRPLIVLVSDKPGENGHYIVANGYKGGDLMSVINPEKGPAEAGISWMLPLWKNSGCLTLLALPSEKK